MDAWKNAFFLQEKPTSIQFLVLGGGGVFGFFLGGGKCRFYFYGRADFSSEDFSRASTRKICPKRGPRKSHEKTTKKPPA